MTNLRTIDNDTRWSMYLTAVADYSATHGHARVPASHTTTLADGTPLRVGVWVSYIRQRQRRNQLDPRRAAQLAALPGWHWGPLPPGPSTDATRDEQIRDLRNQGWSLTQIADRFGLSRQRVHQIVGTRR